MTDSELKRQLDDLRKQVAEMSVRVSAHEDRKSATTASSGSDAVDAEPHASPKEGERSHLAGVIEGMQELSGELSVEELARAMGVFLRDLGQDVKDSKPRALVAAFTAGFVAGKALSR